MSKIEELQAKLSELDATKRGLLERHHDLLSRLIRAKQASDDPDALAKVPSLRQAIHGVENEITHLEKSSIPQIHDKLRSVREDARRVARNLIEAERYHEQYSVCLPHLTKANEHLARANRSLSGWWPGSEHGSQSKHNYRQLVGIFASLERAIESNARQVGQLRARLVDLVGESEAERLLVEIQQQRVRRAYA